jgi:RNA polymerase sigma-70 factor (ECF subfamily)
MVLFHLDFVKQCKKGDATAQKQLFEQLYSPMYRVCFRYLGQQADLMRGLMKSFQKLESFRYENEQSLFVWIRKIMVNEALMVLRKLRNFNIIPMDDTFEIRDQSHILQEIAAEELYRIITQLPLGYRTVFNLYVIEGYAHEEIAQMLQISEVTSRTQLVKAKNKLRNMLTKLSSDDAQTGTGR